MRATGQVRLPAALDPRVCMWTLMIAPGVVFSLFSDPALAQSTADCKISVACRPLIHVVFAGGRLSAKRAES